MKVFENKLLRGIFGCKNDEIERRVEKATKCGV